MTPANYGIIGGLLKIIGKFLLGLFKYLSLAILYAIGGVVLYAVWEFNPFSGDIFSVLYLVGFGLTVILSLLIAFRKKGGNDKSEKRSWSRTKEEDEKPKSWWERRKEKKELQAEREKEEEERREKLAREEELKAQERRLEELRAERLREEIAREERLIDEYRHQSAISAYNKYEEVVSPHPILEEDNNHYGVPTHHVEEPKIDKSYHDNYYPHAKVGGGERGSNGYYTENARVLPKAKEEPKIYMSAVEENLLIHEYSDRFEVYKLSGGEKTLINIEYKDEK